MGYDGDASTAPVGDPTTLSGATTDYDHVVTLTAPVQITFTEIVGAGTVVEDHETLSGPISLVGDPIYDPTTYPWTVSESTTLKITKTVQCLGPGTGLIQDYATIKSGDVVLAEYPGGGVFVTVTSYQGTPVGGLLTPVNKLLILAPYLALAGILFSVYAIQRKRKENCLK